MIDWITRETAQDLEKNKPQAILCAPVLLACGIGGYFMMLSEPAPWIAPVVFLAALIGVIALQNFRLLCCIPLLIALGFGAAQFRANLVHTPILEKKMNYADVTGRIEAIESFEKGVRILLTDLTIEDIAPAATPRKIRVKLWKGEGLRVGDRIEVLAGLNPPSAPVIPGGFDFRRMMYFKSIGAVGFVYKEPVILEQAQMGPRDWLESLRHAIGQKITAALETPESGLASALMIGRRTAINDGDMQAIRDAGLAHMLAISGLHIGLFSGVIFFALRFGMALFPSFALRYPIKKYAAIAAFFGALFYMGIAGATIPTQRAMLSVGVVFLAILIDRSAITLRVVAFAAFVVLLLFPESLMSASFQMSFAAVTALVGFYDWIRPLWSQWHRSAGLWRRAGLYLAGVCMTTVVATLATAPLALYHFQQLPLYGLLANILCVPVLAFWIMPLSIAAFLLMPFGLEGLAFWLMKPGLSEILILAHWTSSLEGAVLHAPSIPFSLFLGMVLIGLGIIILRGHLRIILTLVLIPVTLLNTQWKQYDTLISSKFELIAFRTSDPFLWVNDRRKDQFAREIWERNQGFDIGSSQRLPNEGVEAPFVCGEQGCRLEVDAIKISYLKKVTAQSSAEACDWADVILSREPLKPRCRQKLTLNKFDSYRHGSHGITIEGNTPLITRSQDSRGDRLWR